VNTWNTGVWKGLYNVLMCPDIQNTTLYGLNVD